MSFNLIVNFFRKFHSCTAPWVSRSIRISFFLSRQCFIVCHHRPSTCIQLVCNLPLSPLPCTGYFSSTGHLLFTHALVVILSPYHGFFIIQLIQHQCIVCMPCRVNMQSICNLCTVYKPSICQDTCICITEAYHSPPCCLRLCFRLRSYLPVTCQLWGAGGQYKVRWSSAPLLEDVHICRCQCNGLFGTPLSLLCLQCLVSLLGLSALSNDVTPRAQASYTKDPCCSSALSALSSSYPGSADSRALT